MSQVHFGLDKFITFEKAVVTSGTFDGVHDGHKVIFERLKTIAQKINGVFLKVDILAKEFRKILIAYPFIFISS